MTKRQPRDTQRYHLKRDGKIIHCGKTTHFKDRGYVHKHYFPGSHMVPVGPLTTDKAATEWENKQANKVKQVKKPA